MAIPTKITLSVSLTVTLSSGISSGVSDDSLETSRCPGDKGDVGCGAETEYFTGDGLGNATAGGLICESSLNDTTAFSATLGGADAEETSVAVLPAEGIFRSTAVGDDTALPTDFGRAFLMNEP